MPATTASRWLLREGDEDAVVPRPAGGAGEARVRTGLRTPRPNTNGHPRGDLPPLRNAQTFSSIQSRTLSLLHYLSLTFPPERSREFHLTPHRDFPAAAIDFRRRVTTITQRKRMAARSPPQIITSTQFNNCLY